MRWSPPRSLAVALAGLTLGALPWTASPRLHGQGPPPPAAPAPDADLEKRVEELDRAINRRLEAGQIAEALPPAREKLDLLARTRGKDHWQTGNARWDLVTYQRLAGLPREVQDRYAKAHRAEARAVQLYARGQYAEVALLCRETLTIRRDILGEDHPDIATSYSNLAVTLRAQGKYGEAEAMHRRALAIYLKALGEGHPYIAGSYANLAEILRAQGKSTEAEAMHRRALAMVLKALGEDHFSTAISYAGLAATLADRGKYGEAEAMHRRALAIELKALGEGHTSTAISYANLAMTLGVRGKYGEAEAMYRRALAIQLKALGEGHPATAMCYAGLAATLRPRRSTARPRRCTAAPWRSTSRPWARATPAPPPATDNLADTLSDRGKYGEAESMHRRALAIVLKALGEGHTHTAMCYNNLAWSLDRQGEHDDALRTWSAAAASYEQARLRGAKGLDAALTAGKSPLPSFAMALARAGQPREAWTRWEQGLARGLIDEVIGRAARPLTDAEHDREAGLLGQAQAIDERIGKLLALKALSQEQDELLEDLRRRGASSAARCSNWSSSSRASIAPSRASPPRSKPSRRPSRKGRPSSAGSIKIPITGPACYGTAGTRSGSGSPAPASTAPGPRRSRNGRNASAPSSTRKPPKATPARWPRRWRGSGSNR